MKSFLVLSLAFLSHLGFAQANLPDTQIKSVDIVIHNLNASKPINKAKFVLDVYLNGTQAANHTKRFLVSPGALTDKFKKGREPELTPEGTYHPDRMRKDYVSKQHGGKILGIWETGGMPHSIFFIDGFAIHGSAATVDGKPASKGCVRLKKPHAALLFKWVEAAMKNTGTKKSVTIHVHDTETKAVAEYRRKKDPTLKRQGSDR